MKQGLVKPCHVDLLLQQLQSFSLNNKFPLKIISAGGELSLRKINDKLEMIGPAEFICEEYG